MECWHMDSPSTEIPHKKGGVILGTIKKEKVGKKKEGEGRYWGIKICHLLSSTC